MPNPRGYNIITSYIGKSIHSVFSLILDFLFISKINGTVLYAKLIKFLHSPSLKTLITFYGFMGWLAIAS